MGPKRDVLGEYSEAIREKGLKLITTFHIGRHLGAGHIPRVKEYSSSTKDPILKQLYYSDTTDDEIMDIWVAKVDEVVKNYQPDILWFDSWLHALTPDRKFSMLADYFNQAKALNQDVVVAFKQQDLSTDIGVVDIEKGRMKTLQALPWLTDDSITWGWSYIDRSRAKPLIKVLHSFVDTVSKNGVVLLNIAPKSDGSIPSDQQQLLKSLGKWLTTYGEAIYETRPWLVYGIGPGDKKVKKNVHGGITGTNFNWEDIRFTQKGNALYLHQMGRGPEGSKHVIRELLDDTRTIQSITMLNSDASIKWKTTAKGLEVSVPKHQPDNLVNVYKIVFFKD
jgi:alpha-L-fucosidase